MTGNGIKLLLAVLLLCACAHLTGCGSMGAAQPAVPIAGSDTGPAGPPVDSDSDAVAGGLPAPGEIERGISALVNVRQGADYLQPYGQNVTVEESDLLFSADASAGNAGLAWAVFELHPDAADEELLHRLHVFWRELASPDGCWLGLADWQLNRWRWQPFDQTQDLSLQPARHVDGTGRLLCVLLLSEGSGRLGRLRYGQNALPTARLTLEKSAPALPFTLTLRAEGAADAEGGLRAIAIDPDGGGFVELGLTTELQYSATQPGVFTARLRLTDDEGAERLYSAEWSDAAYSVWDGGPGFENCYFYDIAPLPGGAYYAVGARVEGPYAFYGESLLVVKYRADGSVEWSQTVEDVLRWTNAFEVECSAGPDDSLYVACRHNPNGIPEGFVFLARFAADGSLDWQQCWGAAKVMYSSRISLRADAAGRVYLLSSAKHQVPTRALVLACFSSAGQQLWARVISGAAGEHLLFDPAYGLGLDSLGHIYCAGSALLPELDGLAAWQTGIASFDATGGLLAARAYAIRSYSQLEYFCGSDSGLACVADAWNAEGTAQAGVYELRLDTDLNLQRARLLPDGWQQPLFRGEAQLDGERLLLLNCSGDNSQLLDFGALSALLPQALQCNSYMPAMIVGPDGSGLRLAGYTSGKLPDWQPLELPEPELLNPVGTALQLTVVDWTAEPEASSFSLQSVAPAEPAALSGALVYRLDF